MAGPGLDRRCLPGPERAVRAGVLGDRGIANAEPGSFLDAFFFSVQTLGTIGYGSMYPATHLANAVVVAESVVGLLVNALATGLVFVRFSQTRARVAFSSRIALAPMDGVPTLSIRIGNERKNAIVDATFRLTMTRTERTAEGVTIYRAYDLPLTRERATALNRSWQIWHKIVPGSPLYGETPESALASEIEVTATVSGIDETSLQAVHARRTWQVGSLAWGQRLADVLTENPDGNMVLDLRRFHELVPSAPIEGFPYPSGEPAGPA